MSSGVVVVVVVVAAVVVWMNQEEHIHASTCMYVNGATSFYR
jgi:hypothetical protein